jgi:hypothetical protein
MALKSRREERKRNVASTRYEREKINGIWTNIDSRIEFKQTMHALQKLRTQFYTKRPKVVYEWMVSSAMWGLSKLLGVLVLLEIWLGKYSF